MKKKNGFTLVELLAVIVVLAIIMVIAIPNVINTLNSSKKELFYDQVKSLESKAIAQFTQDVTNANKGDFDTANGIIYRIHEAEDGKCPEGDQYCLNIPDSDLYDGWVKVSREAVSGNDSDLKTLSCDISNSDFNIKNIYYCLGSSCTPNLPMSVNSTIIYEGDDKNRIAKYNIHFDIPYNKPTNSGTKLFFNYKYDDTVNRKIAYSKNYSIDFNGTTLSDDKLECSLTGVSSTYNYVVTVSIRSDNYAVENFKMSSTVNTSEDNGESKEDQSQKNAFYDAIKTYQEEHKANFGEIKLDGKALKVKSNSKCEDNITSTDFNIIFEPNGGNVSSSSPIGISKISTQASSSGNSEINSLPVMEKDGYKFDGWYYDQACTNKVNLVDITHDGYTNKGYLIAASYNYDSSKCAIGYKDVILYAKYTKIASKNDDVSTTVARTQESTTRGLTSNSAATTTTNFKNVTSVAKKTVLQKQIDEKTTVDTNDTSILLDSLAMSGYDIGFYYGKFVYEVTVPNSVTDAVITAQPKNSTSIVTISGAENLEVGLNKIIINVLSTTNNRESNYVIKVSRLDELGNVVQTERKTIVENVKDDTPDPELISSNAMLKSLVINNHIIKFNQSVYDYTVEVSPTEDTLGIFAKAVNNKASLTIRGNSELKDGSVIEILIVSQNGFYRKTYKIHISKPYVETTYTKTLKYIVIGLVVLLIGLVVYINIKKKKELKPLGEEEDINDIYRTDANGQAMTDSVAVSDNGVQQVSVNDTSQVINTTPDNQVINNLNDDQNINVNNNDNINNGL